MSRGLASLPHTVFGRISDFLSTKSILQLKLVSKATEDRICTLVGARKTFVITFCMNIHDLPSVAKSQPSFFPIDFITGTMLSGMNVLTFVILDDRQRFLWQLCLMYALAKQGMDPLLCRNPTRTIMINVRLVTKKIRAFLAHLRPLILHTTFRDLKSGRYDLEVRRACADFLEGKSLRYLFHYHEISETSQFMSWIEFLQKVQARHVNFQLTIHTKGAVDHLLQVASMVKSMDISSRDPNISTAKTINLIKEILKRKWHITYPEVEKLVQFAQHLGKKIKFKSWTSEALMVGKIGEYAVKVETMGENMLSLEHVNLIAYNY